MPGVLEIVTLENRAGVYGWYAEIQDSDIMIPFVGDTIEEQKGMVAALGNRMKQFEGNVEAFQEFLGEAFTLPEGMTTADAWEVLFVDTDQLFYETALLELPEAVSLSDILVDAGVELLAAMFV